jgi:microcystin degradation protein MlrC
MRVGIIGLAHESNTFISAPTVLEDFRREVLFSGEALTRQWRRAHHEMGGFLTGLEKAGLTPVPIFSGLALAKGVVAADAYDTMLGMIVEGLEKAGQLDGLLVAPHGAGVSENHRDMDGAWLSEVRRRIGPDIPMMCTLDPHTNLSQRMIDACDATITYRTNPHIDQKQVGMQAADLLDRTLRGQIKPTQTAAFPPIAVNIEKQQTAQPPCRPMYELADSMLQRPGVLSNSIALGYPYADVEEMGTAFVVVTDNDIDLARRCAGQLSDHLWHHRHDFNPTLVSVEEALDRALAAEAPVCLLDMGDNVGGGSPADSTYLAAALHERKIKSSFVCMYDPQSVQRAADAGPGNRTEFSIGARTDTLHGKPLHLTATVRSLHDGEFTETKPRHGGRSEGHLGPTAIVQSDHGMTIQITTQRNMPFSLEHIRCCDLDPASFRILVAKGVVAPVAAYEEVCKTFIRVNTRGVTSADLSSFDYHHRRRPLFPFEEPPATAGAAN